MICKSPKHTIQHKSPLFSCMRINTSPRRTFLTCYVPQPYLFQLCWQPLSTWRWFFLLSLAPVFSRPVYFSALLLSVAISCYLPNAPHPHSLQLPGKKNTLTVWLEARQFKVIAISVLYKIEDLFGGLFVQQIKTTESNFRELFLSNFIFSHIYAVVLKFHPSFEF